MYFSYLPLCSKLYLPELEYAFSAQFNMLEMVYQMYLPNPSADRENLEIPRFVLILDFQCANGPNSCYPHA